MDEDHNHLEEDPATSAAGEYMLDLLQMSVFSCRLKRTGERKPSLSSGRHP